MLHLEFRLNFSTVFVESFNIRVSRETYPTEVRSLEINQRPPAELGYGYEEGSSKGPGPPLTVGDHLYWWPLIFMDMESKLYPIFLFSTKHDRLRLN